MADKNRSSSPSPLTLPLAVWSEVLNYVHRRNEGRKNVGHVLSLKAEDREWVISPNLDRDVLVIRDNGNAHDARRIKDKIIELGAKRGVTDPVEAMEMKSNAEIREIVKQRRLAADAESTEIDKEILKLRGEFDHAMRGEEYEVPISGWEKVTLELPEPKDDEDADKPAPKSNKVKRKVRMDKHTIEVESRHQQQGKVQEEADASIQRGIKQAKEGDLHDLGSFAQFADPAKADKDARRAESVRAAKEAEAKADAESLANAKAKIDAAEKAVPSAKASSDLSDRLDTHHSDKEVKNMSPEELAEARAADATVIVKDSKKGEASH
jgi:hypothetical protein